MAGRYVYTAYLVPAFPMPGVRYADEHKADPHYDLRTAHRDVCLRIANPRLMLLPPSRTAPFVLQAQQIDKAYSAARVQAAVTMGVRL